MAPRPVCSKLIHWPATVGEQPPQWPFVQTSRQQRIASPAFTVPDGLIGSEPKSKLSAPILLGAIGVPFVGLLLAILALPS